MKQGETRNELGNNIQETKDHGNLETEISETGRQEQESEMRRNRDKWRGVGDRAEIGQRWVGEGEQGCNREGEGWNGVVRDPSAIKYLTVDEYVVQVYEHAYIG